MMAKRIHIALLAGLASAATVAADAQVASTPGEVVAAPSPDADALAAQMHVLAADPRDLEALLSAGELALKLGDPTAAGAFFARAEKVDPHSGRQKAGTAATLLRFERPGEALRLFGEAEALGYDATNYAADRGLAYDLIGDQPRAQRDYRLALSRAREDETLRRYALSLGISGERERALEQIDGLLRHGDRAAWRVRTFVLAMTGDVAGAQRIATTMLPDTVSSGLTPFFRRLPGLSAVDRAWAVHFGEVTPTPERIADARIAPRAAAIESEPARSTQVASNAARGGRRAPPVVVDTLGKPPVLEVPRAEPPGGGAGAGDASPRDPTPAESARAKAEPAKPAGPLPGIVSSTSRQVAPAAEAKPALPTAGRGSARVAADLPAGAPPAKPDSAGARPPAAKPAPSKEEARRLATLKPPSRAMPTGREQSILGRIVADVALPAVESGRSGSAPARSDAGEPPSVEHKRGKVEPAASKPDVSDNEAPARDKNKPKHGGHGKADAPKPEPPRFWVQVAGGARESDLPKAWAAARARAPEAFRGRHGFSTPLRATNRVLTGPFKTAAEAQAFVNLLARQGVSGFVFQSVKGQKVDKLGEP